LTLTEAVAQNLVKVEIGGFREDRDTVAVAVSRVAGVSGRIQAVLPAGTILYSSDPGGQRMMTAKSATIMLAEGAVEGNAVVEVYCLDQFALRPTAATTFTLPGDMQIFDTSQAEPVSDLASCLEKGGAPPGVRQLAIWLVAGRYVDWNYESVRQELFSKYQSTMADQVEGAFTANADRKRRALRHFPPDRVEAALSRYRERSLWPAVERAARRESDTALNGFRRALPALRPCLGDVEASAFFASGPPA
jgi:hypothetical protein